MNTATAKNQIVGLKDLRENMESYIKRVQKGESLTVVRRSNPVFRITPMDVDADEGWETVIDFTKVRKGGVPADEVQAAIRKILSE